MWTKVFDASENLQSARIIQTQDSGYLLMGTYAEWQGNQSIIYLIKLNANGDTTWTKAFGGAFEQNGSKVIQTYDGGYIVVGNTNSYGIGNIDIYVIKTDSVGDSLWTKTYGGSNIEYGLDIAKTHDSALVIVGTTYSIDTAGNVYLMKINLQGDTLWTKSYGGIDYDGAGSINGTRDSGFIISGATHSFGLNNTDVYLIKINSIGDTLWTKTYGGTGTESGAVEETSDSGYIFTGLTDSFGAGYFDMYVFKTDYFGNVLWSKTYGQSYADVGGFGKQTPDKGYIFAGYGVSGSVSYDYDVYLIKTDSVGNSGCNEQNAPTIVGYTQTTVSFPNFSISTGGQIAITDFSESNGSGVITTACISTNIEETYNIESNVDLYPNPATSVFTVKSNAPIDEIKLINQMGQMVYNEFGNNNTELNLNLNLSIGIYIVQIRCNNKIFYRKITIQ